MYCVLLVVSWLTFKLFLPFSCYDMLLWTFICKVLFEHILNYFRCVYLGLELLGHMATLFFNFLRTCLTAFHSTSPFYIFISNIWEFHFVHALFNTCYCPLLFYYFFHPSGCDVASHCSSICISHFPETWRRWITFHMHIGHPCVFFGEMSIQTLSPFVIELLVVVYNFACKYSEFADPLNPLEVIQCELNCTVWGNASNSLIWTQLDFDMLKGLPSGLAVKNSANAADTGSIPGLGRSPGGENGNPLQYSCLKNPMDRVAWWATVHGVTKELDTTEWAWSSE